MPFVDNARPVLLLSGREQTYDYLPEKNGASLPCGTIVWAPFRARTELGVVWHRRLPTDRKPAPTESLRRLRAHLTSPTIAVWEQQFVSRVAAYNLASSVAVLQMMIPCAKFVSPGSGGLVLRCGTASDASPTKRVITPHRKRVLHAVENDRSLTVRGAAQAAGVSLSVVRLMIRLGLLELSAGSFSPSAEESASVASCRPVRHRLSAQQRRCALSLSSRTSEGGFSCLLLDGETGSGKTLVCLEAISTALSKGRQVLVLVPEISLAAQWLEECTRYFDAPPVVWHSGLRFSQRRTTWHLAAHGSARILIGARSALFLPMPHLGLIVVDEEHDSSFKQNEGVVYSARDQAVVRAQTAKVPIVLASATPSLESLHNVEVGNYTRVRLPDRFGGARLPQATVVDLRKEPRKRRGLHWLSEPLVAAIARNLLKKEQTLLYLNRRGYAPIMMCPLCMHRVQCRDCKAWMVWHKSSGVLLCHHCGRRMGLPSSCRQCAFPGGLRAVGVGVERLAEEVRSRFPSARVHIVSSDIRNADRNTHKKTDAIASFGGVLQKMRDREIDILIGTQVVSKGHHFPSLTLVGVIDADFGLYGGDPRACEKTWQVLHQVAGRAGRSGWPGCVYLQTQEPNHPVVRAIEGWDREKFVRMEQHIRKNAELPPFVRLSAIVVSARAEEEAREATRRLFRLLPKHPDVKVFGPAPALLSPLRGRYRWRILLKSPKRMSVQPFIRSWMRAFEEHHDGRSGKDIRTKVDIDPYDFF